MILRFLSIILCFLTILSWCGEATRGQDAAIPAVAAAADGVSAAYRLHSGDKISVRFFYQPELNETSLIVRPDGFISLQLIKDVKAENLTVTELKTELEKAYDEILVKPIISIAVIDFVPPRVFIGGQVNKAGRYDLRDGQTLVQVIFLAGGFTKQANRRAVLHARPNDKGEWQIQSFNALDIIGQKKDQKDFELRDGDYIFVPDSKISQINKAIEGFSSFLPALPLLIR